MSDQDDLKTQPTAAAIMERLQLVETRLAQAVDNLDSRIEERMLAIENRLLAVENRLLAVEEQILAFRAEVNKRFDLLSNKIEVLNEDTLTVRAKQREILKRMNEPELKAS